MEISFLWVPGMTYFLNDILIWVHYIETLYAFVRKKQLFSVAQFRAKISWRQRQVTNDIILHTYLYVWWDFNLGLMPDVLL